MQSSNDRAVRERKLAIPVGFERYLVAQDGTYTVEVACFMGRGDPSPVAIPMRDFSNEGRGGFPIRVSWCRGNEGDRAIITTATRENVKCFIRCPPFKLSLYAWMKWLVASFDGRT
jgi:hypothetical protein